jgi:serine/threonine-protein kinase 40
MLLHTEHALLSLLSGMEGVVQKHDFFTELCLMEENAGNGRFLYNGRKIRRICLVLDCLSPNDFTNRTQDLINLQHHVIREKKLNEREALSIFYSVVTIVDKLHDRNVVHRDLKLGNIVLNLR